MASEIANVLVATLSPDTNTRIAAELRINELFRTPGLSHPAFHARVFLDHCSSKQSVLRDLSTFFIRECRGIVLSLLIVQMFVSLQMLVLL